MDRLKMHPRIKKEIKALAPKLRDTFDTHDGKREFFLKLCVLCGEETVHRFRVGDDLDIGTCEHEWSMTREDVANQEFLLAQGINMRQRLRR